MKKNLKNILVKLLIWLKNSNSLTRGIVIITGQVRDELYDPKTGKTVKNTYAIQLCGLNFGAMALGAFNTIQTQLKNNLALAIGASNASRWVGQGGLATQASFTGKDGIAETDTGYAYTTTKDSGGTGNEDNIVFKGVRTAAGAETHTTLELGLDIDANADATPDDMGTPFASQTISKSLTSAQVYTVFWTLTIS